MSDTVDVTVKLKRPPEGMEWQIREPVPQREYYAGKMVNIEAVLRPIQPATVMVEMSRDDARRSAERCSIHDFDLEECDTNNLRCRTATACRAALARKPYPQFDPAKHVDPTLGPDEVRLDGKVYKLKLPCPVMVCQQLQYAEAAPKWRTCPEPNSSHAYRRPCKHDEGHGGEHE